MKNPFKNTLTPHFLYKSVVIAIFIIGVLWYSIFQARHLIEGPTISLISPTEITHNDRVIVLEGSTENITSLSLNGKTIHTDEKGIFKESLVLENGYTIMTLAAEDRYGRKTSLSRSFVYITEEINNI